MASDTNPAIELLVQQIAELERKANAYKVAVNLLCGKDGLPPMFPDSGGGGSGNGVVGPIRDRESVSSLPQIMSDTFYGKPQQTAVREFLGYRKASGAGPAKPAEILDGLRAGGYQVEAKNDEIALVGLRAMLRKRTNIFHKLPNGAWGLKEWYPNAKSSKDAAEKGSAAPKDSGQPVAETEVDLDDDWVETPAADTNEESAA